MCNKRNCKEILNFRKVDECMAPIIDLINTFTKLKTLGCCCGHGKYTQSIVVQDRNGTIYDLISNQIIPRKKRFYLKDKEGYYYIPEAQK